MHDTTGAPQVSATILLMAVLAVARVTSLVTTDKVTAPLRRVLARRFPPLNVPDYRPETGLPIEGTGRLVASTVVSFVSCNACVSVWLSGFTALLLKAWLPIGWGTTALAWWAISGGALLVLGLANR